MTHMVIIRQNCFLSQKLSSHDLWNIKNLIFTPVFSFYNMKTDFLLCNIGQQIEFHTLNLRFCNLFL